MPEAPSPPARLVHAAAFADPGLVLAGERWWASAGAGVAGPSPALSSVDLLHWQREPDVAPVLGDWAVPRSLTSAEVVRAADGRWLLYYGARCAEHAVGAIGVAEASQPGGPYRDGSPGPLLCPPGSAGVRDPSVLIGDDGTRRLYWSAWDGRAPDGPQVRTRLLDGGGHAFAGPTALPVFGASQPWAGDAVSRPQVVGTGDGFVLLHTAGSQDGPGCSVAIARSASPDGPFTADPQPLLTSTPAFDGPAHGRAVRDPEGSWWLLFSAWQPGRATVPGAHRRLWLGALDGMADPDGPWVHPPVPPPVPLAPPAGQWRLPLPTDPTPDQEAVLRSFTVHGLIRALPVAHARRVVLLDLLAQLFEPGLRYPEPEVDRRLSAVWATGVHPDYARLRRLLVDHGFLDRTGGVYRRSGGTV